MMKNGHLGPLKLMVISILLQNCSSETSQQFSSIGLKRLGIMLVFNES